MSRGTTQGYSKAVDMWAIGVITFLLLFGRYPYPHPSGEAHTTEVDPDEMDEFMGQLKYSKIGDRPKNFLRRLVVNERQRMTAKEAVDHPWFTNERNATEFRELYQRAVKDWIPRHNSIKVLEYVESDHAVVLNDSENPLAFREEQEISSIPNQGSSAAYGGIGESSDYDVAVEKSPDMTCLNRIDIMPSTGSLPKDHGDSVLDEQQLVRGRARFILKEDLQRMNVDLDVLDSSIERPDIFSLPYSDSDNTESSDTDRKAPSSTRDMSSDKKRSLKASRKQGPEPTFRSLCKTNEELESEIGDGFNDWEMQNAGKRLNGNPYKRVRWYV
jgi:serine/threonine protein kinase